MRFVSALALVAATAVIQGCDDDDGSPALTVPATYTFEREGQSTVNYQGQTDRLNQVSEMKAYFVKGDKGELVLDAQELYSMFTNEGGNGGGLFSFSSDRQLKDKTFAADVSYYEALFEEAEAVSAAGADASAGVGGFIARKNGTTILVNANGQEFTQLFEKGIMGSVFLHQIYNVYLTDERTGDNVENTVPVGSANYTPMEHHWDEAFGYWGVPTDFPAQTSNLRFWGNYSNGRDPLLGTNDLLMDAFLTGRAAIVARNYPVKNQQRAIIYEGFERVAASTAIHYLNDAKTLLAEGAGSLGEAFHALSEAHAFIRALRMSPVKKITDAQLNNILTEQVGENFWAIPETDLSGLTEAVETLVQAYPELEGVKDAL